MPARIVVLVAVLLACSAVHAKDPLRGVVKAEKARALPLPLRRALAEDGALVVPGRERHFFALYDRNAYAGIPSFVTLDAVLHLFHVRLDALVAQVEEERARADLEGFASRQLAAALALFPAQGVPEERLKLLALYHAVPLVLLGVEQDLDPRIADAARAEAQRLGQSTGLSASALCPRGLDGSRFKPRGHYVRGALPAYFRATTFYAECAFDLDTPDGLARAADVTRLVDLPARTHLERLRRFSGSVTGPADDPGAAELSPLLSGLQPLPLVIPPEGLAAVSTRLAGLPPGLVPAPVRPGEPPRREFRLLGGAGVPDSVLFGRTTGLDRPFPSALDVLAALGSARARELLGPDAARLPPGMALDRHGLYGAWLALLQSALRVPPGKRPPFESSAAWERHRLVTAAGSWAELRHDTLLYVKAPLVMMQGGHPDSLPASRAGGYVEPRPDLYKDMRALLVRTREQLGAPRTDDVAALEELLQFLERVAALELEDQPFPRDVDERLRTVGTEMERITRGHADELPDQAVIADVHSAVTPDGAVRTFHVGTGAVDELWVVVPRGKARVLMRGGTFSYFEFAAAPGVRLTDREWTQALHQGSAPARPAWAAPSALPPPRRRPRN